MAPSKQRSKRTIRALIVSDGIPGHVSQSRGLAQWLEERWNVEVEEVTINLKHRAIVQLLGPTALRLGYLGRSWILGMYSGLDGITGDFDIIISAGGRTSFANAAIARKFAKPNVFVGSLRNLPPTAFKARLGLEPGKRRDAIVLELPPTSVSASRMELARREFLKSQAHLTDQTFVTALIGGNGNGFAYTRKDWENVANLLTSTARQQNIKLLIATSRRTGNEAEHILKDKIAGDLIADAVWWSEKEKPVTNAYLSMAKYVLVTGESMTMISEAISSGKPTMAMVPTTRPNNKRYDEALARFQARGLLTICQASGTTGSWPEGLQDIERLVHNVLDKLAERLDISD